MAIKSDADVREDPSDTLKGHDTVFTRLKRVLLSNVLALAGSILLVIFVIVAVFAPYIAPYDPGTNFGLFLEPGETSYVDHTGDGEATENWHPLGTDDYGQDVLSQIIYGARISLLVAGATAIFAFSIGATIGLIAGYYGGWVDHLLMRYIDFQWAFPSLILAIGIIAVIGGLGVWNVIIAIGIAYIDDFARIVRGEVLKLRESEFIMAAKTVGMGDVRIMTREILPNSVAPIIVQATLMLPLAILAEAGLSFLGVGVAVTDPSWGMLLGRGQDYIGNAWWISIFPGIAIMIVVLSFNIFGDALRDAFDVTEAAGGTDRA